MENAGTEKTDMEFYSFEHNIGFLSIWHVDMKCHTFILNLEFSHKNTNKNYYHLSWIGSLKMSV